jgi:hypothetical protein
LQLAKGQTKRKREQNYICPYNEPCQLDDMLMTNLLKHIVRGRVGTCRSGLAAHSSPLLWLLPVATFSHSLYVTRNLPLPPPQDSCIAKSIFSVDYPRWLPTRSTVEALPDHQFHAGCVPARLSQLRAPHVIVSATEYCCCYTDTPGRPPRLYNTSSSSRSLAF